MGRRLKNWKTNRCACAGACRSVSPRVVTSVPSMATVPDVGLSSPARMCISVDLPEPDGPMTAVSLPRSTSRLTPRSASTAVSPSRSAGSRRWRPRRPCRCCGGRSRRTELRMDSCRPRFRCVMFARGYRSATYLASAARTILSSSSRMSRNRPCGRCGRRVVGYFRRMLRIRNA